MPVTYVDPRGEVADLDEPYELGIDLTAGTPVIGLLANGFPDSAEFMDVVGTALAGIAPGVALRRFGKANLSAPAPDALLKEIAGDCVAVVTAYGH
jgi:hypothetical protein